MKTYTREELTALTKEQLQAMTPQERGNAINQGRAFKLQDLQQVEQAEGIEVVVPQYNLP